MASVRGHHPTPSDDPCETRERAFFILILVASVAIAFSAVGYVNRLASDNILKPISALVRYFGELPGKLIAGLEHDAKAVQAKNMECLWAGIKAYDLTSSLKKTCPKGADEACLISVLNENHPDVVAECIQKEHTAGLLANLWKGLVCLLPFVCMIWTGRLRRAE